MSNISKSFNNANGKVVFPAKILPFCDFLDNFLFNCFPLQMNKDNLYFITDGYNQEDFLDRFNKENKSLIPVHCIEGFNDVRESFDFLRKFRGQILSLQGYLEAKIKHFERKVLFYNNYLQDLNIIKKNFHKNIINYIPQASVEQEIEDHEHFQDFNEFFKQRFSEIYLLYILMSLEIKDITFIPMDDTVSIKVRYMGIYHEILTIDNETYNGIINRWKMQGRLDLLEKNSPQSAFCNFYHGIEEVNIRVSFHPLINGEKTSIRILNTKYTHLQALNLHPEILSLLNMIIVQRKILFIAGLAGTGKSTLAYGILRALDNLGWHMISIEDPVEYEIPSINQSFIKGLSQTEILKSVLRHDIDRVFVGEIRDLETASMALEAISTGHSIIATLHIGKFSQLKNRWSFLSGSVQWEEQMDFLIFPKIYSFIDPQGHSHTSMLLEIYKSNGETIGPTIEEQILYCNENIFKVNT
jgi:type II secretory ATPase GspE/PulE/Tfp pilus assembly ATPase PilB-like protein